uniref:Gustatory receptor n=1 Tax=Tetranychus urticae TaxID=32264 RepID=T1KJF4_TETUR
MMILIKVLQHWIRSDEVNFPEITINSIASKLILKVSSTSGIVGKCLFAFAISLIHSRYLIKLPGISFDKVFTADPNTILDFSCGIFYFSLFHFKYNHIFVKQIEDVWNELQIGFDYEARKYFWTRKVIYYSVTVGTICLFIHDISYFYHNWPYSDPKRLQNQFDYWTSVMRLPIIYPYVVCNNCILYDLSITAETAIQYIDTQSKRLYKESLKDEKALNFQVIHDLRLKYLQTHRLVNKMNEFLSPYLLLSLIICIHHFIYLVYSILFVQQSGLSRICQVISFVGFSTFTFFITHLSSQVHVKSQQLLMTVYKLSLKTDFLKVLNEITLFVNCTEIGFSLGGICTLTSSAITTLFSILTTLIIAIPSFIK